ncbi:unnamed protein product [Prorocentrum cordatum]|uniref:Tr-type G domain-containing protein n=1 Tax=Prorocentrum cordatum TaxID=2364126 RepID=A0ABN9S6V2_9DINO|nr:unnamed protein product [Polarella glacialis]
MVDGVVLLVDMVEGPKTQTKFVLQKALQRPGMKPIVVINKVDRPQVRQAGEVENEIFDAFMSVATDDAQLEYPTLYASGKAGFCARSLEEARSDSRPTDMVALYEALVKHVPAPSPPEVDPEILAADEKMGGFSMLVSQLDKLPALGPTVTGKVFSGWVQKGDKIMAKSLDGEVAARLGPRGHFQDGPPSSEDSKGRHLPIGGSWLTSCRRRVNLSREVLWAEAGDA